MHLGRGVVPLDGLTLGETPPDWERPADHLIKGKLFYPVLAGQAQHRPKVLVDMLEGKKGRRQSRTPRTRGSQGGKKNDPITPLRPLSRMQKARKGKTKIALEGLNENKREADGSVSSQDQATLVDLLYSVFHLETFLLYKLEFEIGNGPDSGWGGFTVSGRCRRKTTSGGSNIFTSDVTSLFEGTQPVWGARHVESYTKKREREAA